MPTVQLYLHSGVTVVRKLSKVQMLADTTTSEPTVLER